VSALDVFLLVACLLAAVRGYVRGFFREVMGLAGMTLGCIAAILYWWPAALLLDRLVEVGPTARHILAAMLTFAAVNVVTHLTAIGFDRMARATFMTGIMRVAGALVGLGKGATVSAIVLFMVQTYVPVARVRATIARSTIGSILAATARSTLGATETFMAAPAKPREA